MKYGSKQQVIACPIIKDDLAKVAIQAFIKDVCLEPQRPELLEKAMSLLRGEIYMNVIDPLLHQVHMRHGGVAKWYGDGRGKIYAVPEAHCNHPKVLMNMYTTSYSAQGYASELSILDIENYDGARPEKTQIGPKSVFEPTP